MSYELTKLAANSHIYERKAFKIYNKHHVNNHIASMFFLPYKMKIWIFFDFFFFVKKLKVDFKPQMFTFFAGKVIALPETEIEQYVVLY